MADLALAAPPPPRPERGAQLGSGTFGQVYRHASSDSLVIKVLKRSLDALEDTSEVYALEKGRGHPHIVQLHDVAMDSSGMRKRLCLILERCDTDLEKLIREKKRGRAVAPAIAQDCVAGVLGSASSSRCRPRAQGPGG